MASAESSRVVIAAGITANLLIAISKMVAAGFTGSTAMLAEAVHSLADTGNQVLLVVGMRLSRRAPTETHPFGRAVERYFWPFVVSILVFTVGGVFAIYEGVHKLALLETVASGATGSHGSVAWNYGVLGAAILFEGTAFLIASREFRKVRRGRNTIQSLIETRDPTIPTLILEDSAAVVGLIIALTGISLAHLTGWNGWDGIASLLIGALLCTVAVFLARETHSLILGESARPEEREAVRRIVESIDGIERLTQLLSLHRGPEDVLLALKVAFRRGLDVAEVERLTNEAERRIRQEVPSMRHIFIEADAGYDAAKDPDRPYQSLPPKPEETPR